jgi:hypothetical protein
VLAMLANDTEGPADNFAAFVGRIRTEIERRLAARSSQLFEQERANA